jgi:ribosomal protein S18 acetylase RimI-like enzyme
MNQDSETLQQSISEIDERWFSELLIRPLRHADLPALEWEGAYTHFRRIYKLAYQRSIKGNAVLWVAEIPGECVLGQLFVLLRSEVDSSVADGREQAFIHSFRVRPNYRGRGLGSRMLANAESDLLRRRFQRVSLNVAIDNDAAIRLYERAGYQRKRREEGYWSYIDHRGVQQDVHEPSWHMLKSLNG